MSDSLGPTLARARRARGKSLAEAEEFTRIRAKRLDALENGEYDSLPSPAYVKGYIVSYAKFLELDPAPLLEAYEREIGANTPGESIRLPDQVVMPRSQAHHIPARTAFAVVAVLGLLALSVWGVGRLFSGPSEPPPLPVVPETTATPEPDPAVGPGVSDSETTSADVPEDTLPDENGDMPAGPFTVRVAVSSDSASWLRVTVDDLIAYEGTMAGGQSQEWTAEESAVLRIGRAPAVTVYQDGVEIEIPPGDPPVLELPIGRE